MAKRTPPDPPWQRRPPEKWPEFEIPRVIPLSGFRDQVNAITYLPWGSARLGAVGWEVWPDHSNRNTLVYLIPSTDEAGTVEIRCHMTTADPDPMTDRLLGTFRIPRELVDPDE